MFERVRSVAMYTPNLDSAAALYRNLGLTSAWSAVETGSDGTRCTRLGLRFPGGGAELVLHDNANRQFTELEVAVQDIHQVYARLSRDANYLWLELPHPGARGCSALLRAPDGNLFTLVSANCTCDSASKPTMTRTVALKP